MKKLQIHTTSFVDWRPSAVVALAASADGTRLVAAREDGLLEIWLVSPGAVGWHRQLMIHGNPSSKVSSLVWLRSRSGCGPGRLLSSSIDGSISEWNLFSLQQKVVIESVGMSIWQMAVEPFNDSLHSKKNDCQQLANGHADYDTQSDCESSYSENEDSDETNAAPIENDDLRLAIACDDGCMRIYNESDTDGLTYSRSFPRVSGRILSVVWSLNAKQIFSGSSDGLIRCWDTASFHETYCITVGLGGLGSLSICWLIYLALLLLLDDISGRKHPVAAGQSYFISDGSPVNTIEFIVNSLLRNLEYDLPKFTLDVKHALLMSCISMA